MRILGLGLAALALLASSSAAMALPLLNTYAVSGYIEVIATNTDNYTYTCVVQASYTIDSQLRGTVLEFKVPPGIANTVVASFGPLLDPQLAGASPSCI